MLDREHVGAQQLTRLLAVRKMWHGGLGFTRTSLDAVPAYLRPSLQTCAVWQPHARSVRLRRRSVKGMQRLVASFSALAALRPAGAADRWGPLVAVGRGGELWQERGAICRWAFSSLRVRFP